MVRSLSIDLSGAGVKVVALHPGWAQTDMGGSNALITPEESVTALRSLLNGLTQEQSGDFINYDEQHSSLVSFNTEGLIAMGWPDR